MSNPTKSNNCKNCPYISKFKNMLPNSEINKIQSNCMIVNFKKGETIVKQGSDVTEAIYVLDGQVKVFLEGNKKNIIVKLVRAGNYVGLQSLFLNERYYYSISVIEDSVLCMSSKDFFIDIIKKNSDFHFEITSLVSKCTSHVFQKIIEFNQKQVKERLIDVLLDFSDNVFKSKEFILPLTRKELSELCAMSMENTVRLLSEFKKKKIINIEGKKITILQYDILKNS